MTVKAIPSNAVQMYHRFLGNGHDATYTASLLIDKLVKQDQVILDLEDVDGITEKYAEYLVEELAKDNFQKLENVNGKQLIVEANERVTLMLATVFNKEAGSQNYSTAMKAVPTQVGGLKILLSNGPYVAPVPVS